jgi:hypothetical protein
MIIFSYIGILVTAVVGLIAIVGIHTWLKETFRVYKQVYLSIVDVIIGPWTAAYLVYNATDEELFRMYDFVSSAVDHRSTYMIGVWICKMEIYRRGAARK